MGTSNGYAAIPSAIRGLHNGLKLDKDTTNLVIPLGISLNPHGTVMHFAISTMFMVQLYGKGMDINLFFVILFGSILAGLAATGAPGLAALGMISIVLDPLGLPVGVAVILLAAVDPIVDPILTVVNVHSNCASTAVVAIHDKSESVADYSAAVPATT
jgi:Na+/H+-dicarboxylate symporter